MSEKRFAFRPTPIGTHHLCEILDNDKRLGFARHSDVGNVVGLLNEMNDTLVTLTRENHNLKKQAETDDLGRGMLQKELNDCGFILCQDDFGNYEIRYEGKVFHFLWEVAPILNEQQATITKQDEEIKRLEKMIWKIQWRFQQEAGIEKAKEHYQEIDKEMKE